MMHKNLLEATKVALTPISFIIISANEVTIKQHLEVIQPLVCGSVVEKDYSHLSLCKNGEYVHTSNNIFLLTLNVCLNSMSIRVGKAC